MLHVRPLIHLESDESYNLRSPLWCNLLHFSLISCVFFYYQVLLNIMFNKNRRITVAQKVLTTVLRALIFLFSNLLLAHFFGHKHYYVKLAIWRSSFQ